MNSTKVLFISHDANRAGSQLLLLQLVRLLSERGIQIHVLLCKGGELEVEFKAIAPTTVLNSDTRSRISTLIHRVVSKVPVLRKLVVKSKSKQLKALENKLLEEEIGLVFVNSVANASFYHNTLPYLHHLPLVVFAHELEMSVATYTRHDHLNFLLGNCNHLIAVSQSVANFYINSYNFPAERVSTFTLINTAEIVQKIQTVDATYIRQNLPIPANAVVVGGCGNAEWRKGNDIFNLIANEVLKRLPDVPVYFVWVGAGPMHTFFEMIKFDIDRFEMGERIILIPPTSKALDIMTRFDIFLLSSREDPYPLVVLEAALLKKPIVCFENAGGAPELVEKDAGEVVDYLDINAAAGAVISLIQQPEVRVQKGLRAYEKVIDRHNTDQSIKNVLSIIENCIKDATLEIGAQA